MMTLDKAVASQSEKDLLELLHPPRIQPMDTQHGEE